MSERMSAERRAEIARYKQCLKCGSLDVYEELLDELAAVTDECNELRRERDEALDMAASMGVGTRLISNERDRLAAEVEALKPHGEKREGMTPISRVEWCESVEAENKILRRTREQLWAEIKGNELLLAEHDADIQAHVKMHEEALRERDALRARVARLEGLIERCLHTGSMTAPELDGLESELRAALGDK